MGGQIIHGSSAERQVEAVFESRSFGTGLLACPRTDRIKGHVVDQTEEKRQLNTFWNIFAGGKGQR